MSNYKGIINRELTECPHCKSKAIRKAGILPSGYQQYHCRECKRKFSVLTFVKFFHESGKICPYCGTTYTRKSGHLKDGTQRYTCNMCSKRFSDKTVIRKEINKNCPRCGSANLIRSGKFKSKNAKRYKQIYLCKDCGRIFNSTKVKHLYKAECPRCGAKAAYKWEKTKNSAGKNYYYCTECKHKFVKGGKTALTAEQKQDIEKLYNEGVPIETIAIKYNRKAKTIESRLRGYYENSSTRRSLPKKTVQDIIYYGLGAQVPTDYLSEYLHVPEKIVKGILIGYKKKISIKRIKGEKDG